MVVIHRPGDGPNPIPPESPLFELVLAGTRLYRIFDPKYQNDPLQFKYWGPTARFDHHRPEGQSLGPDPDRGVYYAAFNLADCVVEVFGDTRLIECGDKRAVIAIVERQLRLLDLRGSGAMRVGSVAALTKVADRSISQEWARHLCADALVGSMTVGLLYTNAHNEGHSFMLFERAEGSLSYEHADDIRLDDPRLRATLLDIAKQHNLLLL